jgi:hypothetical protein
MSTVYYEADELQAAYEHASKHNMPQAWRNALDKGYNLLLQSDAITVIYGPLGSIDLAYIPSQSEPGTTHLVNGHCTCQAGQNGKPCAHRAAKRLLNIANEQAAARVLELPAKQAAAAPADDGLFKPEDETPEQAAQRVARKRSSVPMTAEQRTGVSREQAMREMAELFDY